MILRTFIFILIALLSFEYSVADNSTLTTFYCRAKTQNSPDSIFEAQIKIDDQPDFEVFAKTVSHVSPEMEKTLLSRLDLPQENRPISSENYHKFHPFLRPIITGRLKDSWIEVSAVSAKVLQTDWQRDLKKESTLKNDFKKINVFAGISSSKEKFSSTISTISQSRNVCYFENANGQKNICKKVILEDHFNANDSNDGSSQFKFYSLKNVKDVEKLEISMSCSTQPQMSECNHICW